MNANRSGGATPLHEAVWLAARPGRGREIVEWLLLNGAGINGATDSGWTPMHVAASGGDADTAMLLLKKGANVNSISVEGTPLDLAHRWKDKRLAGLLVQHGAVQATEQEMKENPRRFEASAQPTRSCG